MDSLLNRPCLRKTDHDYGEILDDLQCNTLAPHRRNLAVFLFFRLGKNPGQNLAYLEDWGYRATPLAEQIATENLRRRNRKSAVNHLMASQPAMDRLRVKMEELGHWLGGARGGLGEKLQSEAIRQFRHQPESRRPLLRSIMLSRAGRDQLGPDWGSHLLLKDRPWEQGMKAREPDLCSNPADQTTPTAHWDPLFLQGPDRTIHIMVMLALDAEELPGCARPAPPPELFEAIAEEKKLIAQLGGGFLGRVWGYRLSHPRGGDIEHFGFRDGISNPTGVETEPMPADFGTTLRNFLLPLSLPDGRQVPGSYCVFRKIEERIDLFAQLPPAAQADAIGRAADGSPLAPTKGPGLNDFDYSNDHGSTDATGGRTPPACPFHAHIRKANPRGSSPGGATEGRVLFGRRGLLYGQRGFDHSQGTFPSISPGPHGVGLLFLAYMGSIQDQFALMQRSWLNSPRFPHADPPAGPDQVAGLPPQPPAPYTTVRGGEYFLVPPRSWLRAVRQFKAPPR